MSIGKIVLGVTGIGVTALGAWFGISKGKENDLYKEKVARFRKTAQKVNGHFKANRYYPSYRMGDPEHGIWGKKFDYFSSADWSYYSNIFPPEARTSKEDMRDFCFKKAEENADDAKEETNLVFDTGLPPDKKFWDACISEERELR
ncbi:hypothetical protein MHF_1044 [Mycoplasma haemofelis Ohio2]|uniref:Uncharacterized protein n=1 Tax=Mycoplasma haemofelis (strain Ohio2) TaxID=859194 RepID=F6FJ96_MYCHI|nr:hypothetical protein MHF_1044 [Mycoplasma haemofelis Ohio2]